MALFGWRKQAGPGLVAVATGQVISVSEVDDPAFAGGSLGPGYAVQPSEGAVVAPADGEVISVFPTKHALTIRDDDGREILVHMGINTVVLRGEGFTVLVDKGDRVTAGEAIATMDLTSLAAAGKDPCIVVTLPTSPDQQLEVIAGRTKAGAQAAVFAP